MASTKMEATDQLTNSVAVVTGASSGIGRATALALARRGAHVLVHARQRQAEAEATAAAIQRFGGDATVVLADLSTPVGQDDLLNAAWSWKQRVDCWINNAGADVLTGAMEHATFEQKLDALWHVDVVATIRLTRAAAQRMIDQDTDRSCIINIGWDHAAVGMAGESGQMFAAAKGAVASFTQSAAPSYAPKIRLLCVAPGWIRTQWGENASSYWQTRARQSSLMDRWGTPEDVANVIAFLSSPAAAFVNGQVISVNGGLRTYMDDDA